MTNQFEYAKTLGLKQVEAYQGLINLFNNGAESLLKLQLEAGKQWLAQATAQAQSLAQLSSPAQGLTFRSDVIEQTLESVVDYTRNVYEITSRTQAGITKFGDAQLAEINREVLAALDTKNVPTGSESALAAAKQTVQATVAAVDSMSKAAKQVGDFAEASVKAAATATVDAIKTAAKSASKTETPSA